MGIKIDSCSAEFQPEDVNNSYIYCCKKNSLYNNNFNSIQIEVNNINNDISNNKNNTINDKLPTNENIISKIKTMKTKTKKNNNNLNTLYLDKYITNSTFSLNNKNENSRIKQEKYLKNVIKIQSCFRKYMIKKKEKNNIIKNNNKNKSENDNINLQLNIGINETIYNSLENDKNSNKNLNEKINLNILSDNTLISSTNDINQFPFNFKNKNNLNYKYFGYSIPNNSIKDSSNRQELIKEGFGKMIFNDGSEFCGIFHNNKLKSFGKYTNIGQKNNKNNYEEKVIIITENLYYEEFIGEYKDYSPNGFGIYKNYLTNLRITGIFINNNFSGIGIEESGEGGYIYSGEFIYNKKEGYGKMEWKDGQKYWGKFKNNQMNGYGIIEYPEKIYYQGQIKDGKMEGFGEFFWKANKKYIGNYKNDKRNGFGVFIFKGEDYNNNYKLKPEINKHDNSVLNGFSAYIGFWKDGKMDGFGLKINNKIIKYGIWDNGQKKKWFEKDKEMKSYLKNNVNKKYINFFLSSELIIYNCLEKCINNDKDMLPFNNNLFNKTNNK